MIKINNLYFQYNKKSEALKNVSLTIEKGQWVSILGHNGSGKSTLAKLLIGLLEPNNGEIFIDGTLLTEETVNDIRKKTGIVFQNPDNQFVGVTVRYDMAFGLENQMLSSEEMEKRILEYATFVGMEDFLEKEPHTLSGGQKQKVAIAGALAMQHEILILDEATSMLDPKGTNEIVGLIKKISEDKSKTIITITHDLAFASKSDYLYVLKEGELILEGKPLDVFKQEELLKSSHLEIPLSLSIYNEISKDDKINKKLLEELWAFTSKM